MNNISYPHFYFEKEFFFSLIFCLIGVIFVLDSFPKCLYYATNQKLLNYSLPSRLWLLEKYHKTCASVVQPFLRNHTFATLKDKRQKMFTEFAFVNIYMTWLFNSDHLPIVWA